LKAENRNQRPSAVEQQRNIFEKTEKLKCCPVKYQLQTSRAEEINHRTGVFQIPACGHRHAAALGRFADFFAKGSTADPVGNHCPVANRHVFAPRHGPLVWHCSLKSCPVKPINKSEILKAENLTCCPVKYQRQPGGIWNGFHGPKDFTGQSPVK